MCCVWKIQLSYQCNLSVCKNADSPSISTNMDIVNVAHTAKDITIKIDATSPDFIKPFLAKTICHNISDNSVIETYSQYFDN